MSRGTVPPSSQPGEMPPRPPASRFETLIEERLGETRRQVKGVDVVAGILTLGIGTLAYLLLAVVLDHWVVPEGLGFWGRFLLLAGLLGGAGCYFVRVVLPPLMHRVNPIFAAHTIERSRPSLKNSLINFLLLRGHRQEVAPVVYQAMEHRAAVDLSQVEIEVAVERKHVFRLAYVLAAVVAVSGLYLALWPQKTAASAARVILPWAGIDAPTRVTIKDVDPGNMLADQAAYRGDFVTVSARVEGLHDDEEVVLYYSTADEQTDNEAITMKLIDGYRHQCQFPPGELRLQQDVRYRLEAGDCTTPWYKIEVQTAPAILVDAIQYEYPPYTGISDWTDEESRDIRAIEGTVVTIRATANRAIQRAAVDMNCDGQLGLEMTVDGDRATRRLPLRLDPADPSRPEYESYRLRFTDRNGRWNPRPIRHWIEVIPDLPPEIELLYPEETDVELAEDQRLEIRVRAEDPDFALSRVVLHAERDGEALPIAPLLDGQFEGEFQKEYVFQPSNFGLTGGDVVNYWAEAEDNKTPQPGVARTAQYRIRIVSPQRAESPRSASDAAQQSPSSLPDENPQDTPPQEPTDDGQPPPDAPPQEPDDNQSPGEKDDPGTKGEDPGEDSPNQEQADQPGESEASPDGEGKSESASDLKGEGEPSEESSEPIDPEAEPGDAVRKIIEQMEKQEKNGAQSDQPEPSEQKPGEQQPGEQQPGEQKPGEQQPGEQKPGEQQPGEQKPGEQQPGEQQPGEQQPGEQQPGEQKPGEQQPGEQQPGEQQPSEQQPGAQQPGEQQPGEQKPGEQKPGEQKPGEQQPGEQKPGEKQPQSQSGKGESSEDQSGSTTPQAGNQPKEKKPGEGGQDQPKPGQDSPDSPGTSPKQSDSESRTEGDRAGGGGKGGAQPANQDGTGSPGSNTDADEGASKSDQPGEGETGSRGGDKVETDQETGSSSTKPERDGSGRQPAQPGSEGAADNPNRPDDSSPGEPMQNPPDGGRPGDRTSEGPGAMGDGAPVTGGGLNQRLPGQSSPDNAEPGGDDPNLEYARKQSELVLEYLKNLSDQQRSELLDRLRWTEDQERAFRDKLAQWNGDAEERGPRGDAARDALLSFGLRPGGTELRSDQMAPDRLEKLREGLRSPAPGKWSEWLRAYNRGVAGGGR
ncbi:MAG TPA: hypothetical protein VMY42_11110 [Thermoguttaceae bacterium]|nr:hypothetical protein [Thermoguttaceae bacterium]